MARRLCFEERVRIEEMVGAGLDTVEVARCSGRHPTTARGEPVLGSGACQIEARAIIFTALDTDQVM